VDRSGSARVAAPTGKTEGIMRTKKGLLVLAVAALPLASVVLLQGTAVAGKVTGTGAVVCHVSGRLTFDPPLTPNGTAASKEVVTVSSSAVDCSGGTPAASPGATVTKPIKTKATKVGKTKIAGSCKSASSTSATIKGKQSWNGGVKPSKFVLSGLKFGLDSNGEVDEVGTSATTGSYAGNGRVHIDFNSSSSTALENCELDTSSAQVSSATIDETNSTIGE
jgi:hypothetical protein